MRRERNHVWWSVMRWWTFLVGSTWCAALALGCSSQPPPRSQPSPLLSNMLPGFDSQTVSGNQLDTSKFYGQTLVVSFVSSNCRACEKTLAAAQATYADFHDVTVVGIFSKENAASALRLSKEHDLKFPVVADPDGKIAAQF